MTGSKILATMRPGMTGLLRRINIDPDVTPHHVHGPMLRGLMVRGLVKHHGNRLQITLTGHQVLTEMEAAA